MATSAAQRVSADSSAIVPGRHTFAQNIEITFSALTPKSGKNHVLRGSFYLLDRLLHGNVWQPQNLPLRRTAGTVHRNTHQRTAADAALIYVKKPASRGFFGIDPMFKKILPLFLSCRTRILTRAYGPWF